MDTTRFQRTETEYNEWIIEQVQDALATTVHYTGGNNVDYSKDCIPQVSDVQIESVTPLYLPHVSHDVSLGEYTHPVVYAAAGAARETLTSPARCVHCGDQTAGSTYTFCENCGSINCTQHTKTERLEGEPICTGCALTESFMWSTNYFYDEANLEAFREEYASMPIYRNVQENTPLTAGLVLLIIGLFAATAMLLI